MELYLFYAIACVCAGSTFWAIWYGAKLDRSYERLKRFKPSENPKKMKESEFKGTLYDTKLESSTPFPIFDYPINNLNESVNTGLIDSIISGVGSAGTSITKDVEYGGGSFGGAGASDSWNDSSTQDR